MIINAKKVIILDVFRIDKYTVNSPKKRDKD